MFHFYNAAVFWTSFYCSKAYIATLRECLVCLYLSMYLLLSVCVCALPFLRVQILVCLFVRLTWAKAIMHGLWNCFLFRSIYFHHRNMTDSDWLSLLGCCRGFSAILHFFYRVNRANTIKMNDFPYENDCNWMCALPPPQQTAIGHFTAKQWIQLVPQFNCIKPSHAAMKSYRWNSI